MSMSVSLTMAIVNKTVLIPLAASTAAVGQDTDLTKMGKTAPVNSKQL